MNNEQYVLVKYNHNWADEIDLQGFVIYTVDEWNEYKFLAKRFFEQGGEYEYWVGTNESRLYMFEEDLMKRFTVIPILPSVKMLLDTLRINKIGFYGPELTDLRDKTAELEELDELLDR